MVDSTSTQPKPAKNTVAPSTPPQKPLLTYPKPGPIVRIGPNELVTNDFEVWRKISAVRSPYSRSNWADGMRLDPEYNNVISERDEARHNALRAKMKAGVSPSQRRSASISPLTHPTPMKVFRQRKRPLGGIYQHAHIRFHQTPELKIHIYRFKL